MLQRFVLTFSVLLFLYLFQAKENEDFLRVAFQKRGLVELSNSARTLQTYSVQELLFSSESFSTEVDFGANFPSTSNLNMLIFLSSNETAFFNNCSLFLDYECNDLWCKVTSEESLFSLPFVSNGEAKRIRPTFSWNSNSSWQLNASALFFEDSSCKYAYPIMADLVSETYGWIGMGTEGSALLNYQTANPIFSIYINSSTGEGEMIFGKDTSIYNNCLDPITLVSDSNWQMETYNISLEPLSVSNFGTTLIFDLQTEYIILPLVFESLLTYFKTYHGFDCLETPCTFTGNISDLPDLIIGVSSNITLTIPPSIYMRNNSGSDEVYSFGIKTASALSTPSYTVLGWPVLSSYYTVFEKGASNSTVKLYSLPYMNCPTEETTEAIEEESSSFAYVYMIVLALVAVIFFSIIGTVVYKANKARKRKQKYASEVALSRLENRTFVGDRSSLSGWNYPTQVYQNTNHNITMESSRI